MTVQYCAAKIQIKIENDMLKVEKFLIFRINKSEIHFKKMRIFAESLYKMH